MMNLLIFFFTACNFLGLLAQSKDVFEISKRDQKRYEAKVQKYFEKLTCYEKEKVYSLYFLYHVDLLGKKDKNAFTSDQLLQRIKFIVTKENAGYPSNQCFIYDRTFDIKGYSDDLRVTCTFDYPLYENLLKFLIENEIEKVFHISGTNGGIYFGLKQSEILVFNVSTDKLLVRSLEEFKNCCFNDLLL